MQLRLSDPSYTDRLANFLRSLGQTVYVAGPAQLELDLPQTNSARAELSIYVRVWTVLYPDAEVQVENDDDNEEPAA
jgi:fructoselysine-6-P-deglycase FrlB-like protein